MFKTLIYDTNAKPNKPSRWSIHFKIAPLHPLWPRLHCLKIITCWRLLKTGCNNVVLPTLFIVVDNIVQHCYTWLQADSGSTMLNNIVDNYEQCGQHNIVAFCFQQPWTSDNFQACSVCIPPPPTHTRPVNPGERNIICSLTFGWDPTGKVWIICILPLSWNSVTFFFLNSSLNIIMEILW